MLPRGSGAKPPFYKFRLIPTPQKLRIHCLPNPTLVAFFHTEVFSPPLAFTTHPLSTPSSSTKSQIDLIRVTLDNLIHSKVASHLRFPPRLRQDIKSLLPICFSDFPPFHLLPLSSHLSRPYRTLIRSCDQANVQKVVAQPSREDRISVRGAVFMQGY